MIVNAILIEQNDQAAEQLAYAISRVGAGINIEAAFHNVEAALTYLNKKSTVDIIFSEVSVQHEFSFKVFDQTNSCTPVIFVTEEADYMLKAFEQ